jgi:hypothetical protein
MTENIKHLQDRGYSIRSTADILSLDKDTVNKYFNMTDHEIALYQKKPRKTSQFLIALDDIVEILTDPERNKMSAVKLLREIKKKYPFITSGERAFRNFLNPLISEHRSVKTRIFEPIKHAANRCQIQVDGGEGYILVSKNKKRKIYFIAFTLCYSSTIFVSFQYRPFNTSDMLRAHLESFQYFGGVGQEYLYDQTTLVVISEKYREIEFNREFLQFKNKYGFRALSCAAGDPQSKGKVENTIGYIKRDFLYGSYFPDLYHLRKEALNWLDTVANVRIHGTTKRAVDEAFLEVKSYLNTEFYSTINKDSRRVDKTGLISYLSNYFSVPFVYQGKEVIINPIDDKLFIFDTISGLQIGEHTIPNGKGIMVKDPVHYPSKDEIEKKLTQQALDNLKDIDFAEELIHRLKQHQSKIIRAQLRGIISLSKKYASPYWNDIKDELLSLPQIGCRLIERLLKISLLKMATVVACDTNHSCIPRPPSRYAPVWTGSATVICSTSNPADTTSITSSCLDRDIKIYNRSIKNVEPN